MTNLIVSWLVDVLSIHLKPPPYICVSYNYHISGIYNLQFQIQEIIPATNI